MGHILIIELVAETPAGKVEIYQETCLMSMHVYGADGEDAQTVVGVCAMCCVELRQEMKLQDHPAVT